MTTKQRLEKYIQEHCKNCKNRKGQDCEIRVFETQDSICTKCVYYERQV